MTYFTQQTAILTFSSNDIWNSSVTTVPDDKVLFVIRTSDTTPLTYSNKSSSSSSSSSLRNTSRNPTIVARPKTNRAEAEIVACLQWLRSSESRISIGSRHLCLNEVMPSEMTSRPESRKVYTPMGEWTWSTERGYPELLDAQGQCAVRLIKKVALSDNNNNNNNNNESMDGPPNIQVMSMDTLAFLDIIICSLLVVIHEQEAQGRMWSLKHVPAGTAQAVSTSTAKMATGSVVINRGRSRVARPIYQS